MIWLEDFFGNGITMLLTGVIRARSVHRKTSGKYMLSTRTDNSKVPEPQGAVTALHMKTGRNMQEAHEWAVQLLGLLPVMHVVAPRHVCGTGLRATWCRSQNTGAAVATFTVHTAPMFNTLNHDEWAAVGQYLDPVSLYQLSCTCMGLYKDINSNNALWRGQAVRRWPTLFDNSSADTVSDWYGCYRTAHKASCKLSTFHPLTTSITSTRSNPAPRTALLLVCNTLCQVQDRSSNTSSRSGGDNLAWHSCTYAAAAFGNRLHFCKWTFQADLDPPFVGQAQAPQGMPEISVVGDTAEPITAGTTAAAAAAGPTCQHWFSDKLHNHSTGPVSVLIQVPTGGALPGFATGSTDSTIKLWTPFSTTSNSSRSVGNSGSSSSRGSAVRPCRTLTGHTDCVTALACLNPQHTALTLPGSNSCTSSSGSSNAAVQVLVSGSADKSIRLWSLASIQQGQGAPSSSSNSRVRQGGQKQQQKQQQARNPLLGTLHGHSGTVTSLLPWPTAHSVSSADTTSANPSSSSSDYSSGSSSSSMGILSGSKDGRVKLWDVSEGRRSCASTWRLTGPCRQLLDGLDMPGCAVVMLETSLQILDTRVASTGSAVSQGVITLHWPSKHLTTAAVRGTVVAAGGREGVRAWDLRMPPCGGNPVTSEAAAAASSGTSGGGSGSSKRLLLSGSLPNKAPVSHLHLDPLKLVAASSQTKLHCAAGIAVWSLLDGNRVELPSSCLSGVNLHPTFQPYRAASQALNCTLSDAHAAMAQVIDQLSENQAEEAVAIRSGELPAAAAGAALQQQHNLAPGEGSDSEAEGWGSDGEDSASDDGHGWNGIGMETSLLDDRASTDSLNDDVSNGISSLGDYRVGDAAVSQAGRAVGSSRGRGSASGPGCIEPGVLALGVHGPVIACIDSLGNFLLRDFTSGVPGPELLQSFAEPRPSSTGNAAIGHSHAGVSTCPEGLATRGSSEQIFHRQRDTVIGRGAICPSTDAAVAAADQILKLKFWQ